MYRSQRSVKERADHFGLAAAHRVRGMTCIPFETRLREPRTDRSSVIASQRGNCCPTCDHPPGFLPPELLSPALQTAGRDPLVHSAARCPLPVSHCIALSPGPHAIWPPQCPPRLAPCGREALGQYPLARLPSRVEYLPHTHTHTHTPYPTLTHTHPPPPVHPSPFQKTPLARIGLNGPPPPSPPPAPSPV